MKQYDQTTQYMLEVGMSGEGGGVVTRVGEMGQCSNTVGMNAVLHPCRAINCCQRFLDTLLPLHA